MCSTCAWADVRKTGHLLFPALEILRSGELYVFLSVSMMIALLMAFMSIIGLNNRFLSFFNWPA